MHWGLGEVQTASSCWESKACGTCSLAGVVPECMTNPLPQPTFGSCFCSSILADSQRL